jgi:hypothetical protein
MFSLAKNFGTSSGRGLDLKILPLDLAVLARAAVMVRSTQPGARHLVRVGALEGCQRQRAASGHDIATRRQEGCNTRYKK